MECMRRAGDLSCNGRYFSQARLMFGFVIENQPHGPARTSGENLFVVLVVIGSIISAGRASGIPGRFRGWRNAISVRFRKNVADGLNQCRERNACVSEAAREVDLAL